MFLYLTLSLKISADEENSKKLKLSKAYIGAFHVL